MAQSRPKPVGNLGDPNGMAVMMNKFLDWMQVHNYSERTVTNHHWSLSWFIEWAQQREIARPNEVTKPVLDQYQRHLYHYRKQNGQPLSSLTQRSWLSALRGWFRWLTKHNHILYNPASEIELPKFERRLPKNILSVREVEAVLAVPDLSDPLGVRDRAVLETLYSTGIRRMEIANLKLHDIDVDRGTLMIRQGKGKKDRVVPIGTRALDWLDKYIREVRHRLVVEPQDTTLFLTNHGEPLNTNRLSQLVRQHVTAADIGKSGSCHLFRHSMATLMLENGADIRFIQAMLGHATLESTQVYTQVSIRQLKQIHEATHPARAERKNAG